MYALSIQGNHNYFVGKSEIIVHNFFFLISTIVILAIAAVEWLAGNLVVEVSVAAFGIGAKFAVDQMKGSNESVKTFQIQGDKETFGNLISSNSAYTFHPDAYTEDHYEISDSSYEDRKNKNSKDRRNKNNNRNNDSGGGGGGREPDNNKNNENKEPDNKNKKCPPLLPRKKKKENNRTSRNDDRDKKIKESRVINNNAYHLEDPDGRISTFIEKKNWNGKRSMSKAGNYWFIDDGDNCWNKCMRGEAHGEPHYYVIRPNGKHENVLPNGLIKKKLIPFKSGQDQ